MTEPLTTGAVFGVVIVLVDIVKRLIEKLTAKKDDESSGSTLSRIEAKQDAFGQSLAQVASCLERQSDCIERIEKRLDQRDLIEQVELRSIKQSNGA